MSDRASAMRREMLVEIEYLPMQEQLGLASAILKARRGYAGQSPEDRFEASVVKRLSHKKLHTKLECGSSKHTLKKGGLVSKNTNQISETFWRADE